MICSQCGAQNHVSAMFCAHCGNMDLRPGSTSSPPPPPVYQPGANLHAAYQPTMPSPPPIYIPVPVIDTSKSKLAAALLAFFLGGLGIHRFYLGYTGIGITQLVLGLAGWITCGATTLVAIVWALVDFLLIIFGSLNKDAAGNPLRN
jgi:TM2 domain-containing membrane protein YozV